MNQHMITPSMHSGQRNVPSGAMDVWSQGPNQTQLAVPSPHQHAPAPASPVAVVQRLLRGRIALAVVLAGIGAIIGAAAGYMSQAPIYKSQGLISINPVVPLVEGDKAMPYYQQFMSSEALKIASPQIINEVPKYEPWKSLFGNDANALLDLSANVKTLYQRNTFTIGLEYDAAKQEVASAGVQSLIKAYSAQFKQNSSDSMMRKISEQKSRVADVVAKNDVAEKIINDITATYGTPDLQNLVTSAQSKVESIDRELRGNENNYKAATDAIEGMRNGANKIPIEELAEVDDNLKKQLGELRSNIMQEQLDEKMLGPNHRKVQNEKNANGFMQVAIEEQADNIRKEVLAIIPDFVRGGSMRITPGDLRVLETRVNTLRSDMFGAKKERDQIAADAGKVAAQQTAMRKFNNDLTDMNDALTKLNFQAAVTGDLSVMQDGAPAVKATDKKILFGLAGAMVGSMIPVGILMLLGLMDTRFRYSDDAAGQSMAGIPLLGILPNLPDRLSDPAQASIAAHCVHQIRTMLQLNSMREQSTVFAITSASSGDGKTSLSLALGLSFAASGSRTLLIDADLVGGGLTSRLGNTSAVGIVDALAGVGLEECVQPTDVADLSLLPIGGAQAHHAGSFSPPAVRKMLAEVRKHYEVIIVDTGPVMGSIEATPIAASVDGVVLTVARGQSRPLVERAITHLHSIGARVAGVVFNRAQHKDFEQSIGAISIRSAARSTVNGTGHNARGNADMGAVAKAVATSVRSDN